MGTMRFICNTCGQMHEGWPALAYNAPMHYNILSDEDKQNIAELTDDFCIIYHGDQTDRFIRCVLKQKVIGQCQSLEYGLWASLSEKSYTSYKERFSNNTAEQHFGWICNYLPDYTFPKSIPATIVVKPDGLRPEIIPHKDVDHPFVHDYYNGITRAEAEKRIANMLNAGTKPLHTPPKKQWWKIW